MSGRRSLLKSLTVKKVVGMIFWPPKLIQFLKSLYLNANYRATSLEELDATHRHTLANFHAVLMQLPATSAPPVAVEHRDYTQPSTAPTPAAAALSTLFQRHGSDKATKHNYHEIYSQVLGPLASAPVQLLEIGMGTPHIDIPSNMGVRGHPGASLRAFREYLPQGLICGADVDRRILFQEDRIRTFFVDQTRFETFASLAAELPRGGFDLIIDDGLHMPHANLNTLRFALPLLKPAGIFIIEDISPSENPVWEMIGQHLSARGYRCQLIHTRGHSDMFAVISPGSRLSF